MKSIRFFSLMKPLVEVSPTLAAIYRGVRIQLDLMTVARLTPWGFRLSGNESMAKGLFEPQETEIILKLLGDRDVFINVGANIGYYCCLAKVMGKHVIAFEPIHRNLQHLCRNMKLNGWDDAEIYPFALSDQVGIVEMFGSDTGASMIKGWAGIPEAQKAFVPTSTLDIMLLNRYYGRKLLILVDVEGAEYLMLRGALGLLDMQPKPIWIMEITALDNQPKSVKINPKFEDTFEMFFRAGYQARTADKSMRPVTRNDIKLVLMGKKDLGVHNFIFSELEAES
jgi:FkbM family methyltransferase